MNDEHRSEAVRFRIAFALILVAMLALPCGICHECRHPGSPAITLGFLVALVAAMFSVMLTSGSRSDSTKR